MEFVERSLRPRGCSGGRKGKADKRCVWHHVIRYVQRVRPRAAIFENVAGMVAGEHRATFRDIIEDIHELGYHIDWRVLNLIDLNIPQNRLRLYVIPPRAIIEDTQRGPESRVLACDACMYLPSAAKVVHLCDSDPERQHAERVYMARDEHIDRNCRAVTGPTDGQ